MNLFEISSHIRMALTELETCEDEDMFEKLSGILNTLEGTAEQKVEFIIKLIREEEVLAEAAKAEAKRISDFARARENSSKAKRKYLTMFMVNGQYSKLKTSVGSVSLLEPKARLEVDTALVHQWPQDVYERCVTERVDVNKTALKSIFGQTMLTLPGVSEVPGEPSITIR